MCSGVYVWGNQSWATGCTAPNQYPSRVRFVGFYPQAFAKEPPLAILWLTSPSKPAQEDPAVKRLSLLRADLVRLPP